jgi:hypothetical protein
MDFNKALKLILEKETDEDDDEGMRDCELACGCTFSVPANIKAGSDEEEEYLWDHHYLLSRQVRMDQHNAVCSKCHATVMKDI